MDYDQFAQTHFAGNVSAIAREFGVTRAAVQSWKRKKQIPELRAAQIELWLIKNTQPGQGNAGSPAESS